MKMMAQVQKIKIASPQSLAQLSNFLPNSSKCSLLVLLHASFFWAGGQSGCTFHVGTELDVSLLKCWGKKLLSSPWLRCERAAIKDAQPAVMVKSSHYNLL